MLVVMIRVGVMMMAGVVTVMTRVVLMVVTVVVTSGIHGGPGGR